jgi:hypothetical protein
MEKSKYKRFITDSNVNVSRTTLYRRNKLQKKNNEKSGNYLIENNNNAGISNEDTSHLDENNNHELVDSNSDPVLNDQILTHVVEYNHTMELIINETDLTKKPLDEIELVAVLLTLFYDSKTTQTGFSSFLETTNLITNYQLPNSFKSCSNKLV